MNDMKTRRQRRPVLAFTISTQGQMSRPGAIISKKRRSLIAPSSVSSRSSSSGMERRLSHPSCSSFRIHLRATEPGTLHAWARSEADMLVWLSCAAKASNSKSQAGSQKRSSPSCRSRIRRAARTRRILPSLIQWVPEDCSSTDAGSRVRLACLRHSSSLEISWSSSSVEGREDGRTQRCLDNGKYFRRSRRSPHQTAKRVQGAALTYAVPGRSPF